MTLSKYFTYYFLLIAFGLMSSCISKTKIFPKINCHICMSQADGILLLPLSWEPSFRTLSIAQQNELEEMILFNLREQGFEKVELRDRLDYELLKAGIKDLNDPAQRAELHTGLGYPYLLGLSLGEAEWKGQWQLQDNNDLNSPTYWGSDESVSAFLRLALIDTHSTDILADYAIQTTQNGIPIPIGDEESLDLNFGSVSQAITIATRKGMRHLIEDCGC